MSERVSIPGSTLKRDPSKGLKRGEGPKANPEKVRAFVERGRRSSAESLSPGETKRRKPMKRSQPRRDWRAARAKVEREGMCRHCGLQGGLEAAHVVGREHDQAITSSVLFVQPDRVVPLCGFLGRNCHAQYDAHQLDLLPYLTSDEKRQALEDLDWDVFAFLHRTTGCRWAPEKEAA